MMKYLDFPGRTLLPDYDIVIDDHPHKPAQHSLQSSTHLNDASIKKMLTSQNPRNPEKLKVTPKVTKKWLSGSPPK